MSTKTSKTTRVRKADFDNEEAVLKEVASSLGISPDDCQIRSGSAPNGCGEAYTISEGRHTEYIVMRNEELFEEAAVEGVERDLQDEPENFSSDFLAQHINIYRLRRDLHSDVYDSNYDRLQDEASRHPLRFFADHGIDLPAPTMKQVKEYAEAMSDEKKSTADLIEEIAESETNSQLRDPMDYLSDIYGSTAAKEAIKIAGIDTEAAAQEAVSTDGAAHFMCNYDGNYQTTKSGFIVWRHN